MEEFHRTSAIDFGYGNQPDTTFPSPSLGMLSVASLHPLGIEFLRLAETYSHLVSNSYPPKCRY
jgi:hypothetical protein